MIRLIKQILKFSGDPNSDDETEEEDNGDEYSGPLREAEDDEDNEKK